jgi:Kef-type K+ transport system membrane component KefB
MKRAGVFYSIIILVFGSCTFMVLRAGSRLDVDRTVAQTSDDKAGPASPSTAQRKDAAQGGISQVFRRQMREPLSILIMQMVIIITAAKLLGSLFVRLNQPAVIGEMMAGIFLGPSLLGAISPATLDFLFPASSLGALGLLSQIGVVLFMFVVGMDLNLDYLREKAHAAVMVSHTSIMIPFFFGVTLCLVIYRPLGSPNVRFVPFALFMGVAMSITAFPVLARIIEDRRLMRTRLGNVTMACAAVDDITAWCLLALIVAAVRSDGLWSSILKVLMALLFVAFALFVIKPALNHIIRRSVDSKEVGKGLLAAVLIFVFISAWVTEIMGIHALFGAFLAGIAMPSAYRSRSILSERFDTFVASPLLPLFFAFTGLRTRVQILADWEDGLFCLVIICVAIVGKGGGSMLGAKWSGMSWENAFSLGALMNTRGLVELVALNVGYDLGIINARVFAMMVIMAIVTTCMAGPLLSRTNRQDTSIAYREMPEPLA